MKRITAFLGIFVAVVIFIYFGANLYFHSGIPTQLLPAYPTITPAPNQSATISKGSLPTIPFKLPDGYSIHVFGDVPNARDMEFTKDGTLLVSSPSTNHVYALPDKNNDGVADIAKQIISNEPHVHGLVFYNGQLFIADTTKVVRYNWDENSQLATKDKDLFSLPGNNDHNNRTLVFDKNGSLYVSLGSTCNVCREPATTGGSVLISNANGDSPKVFATGLRNAAFLALNPTNGAVWDTEMGRDYLGDNLPPDEINILSSGKNYGWPNCYGDKVHDTNFDKSNYDCSQTLAPIYQVPAHSAPLGLTFIESSQFPKSWQGSLFVAYHGDWNRSTPIGFKVVRLTVQGNTITGSEDFLTGFLQSNLAGAALGRPADVTFDSKGNLYVSDDKAGKIYIIQKT